jgi:hypothetical protein
VSVPLTELHPMLIALVSVEKDIMPSITKLIVHNVMLLVLLVKVVLLVVPNVLN